MGEIAVYFISFGSGKGKGDAYSCKESSSISGTSSVSTTCESIAATGGFGGALSVLIAEDGGASELLANVGPAKLSEDAVTGITGRDSGPHGACRGGAVALKSVADMLENGLFRFGSSGGAKPL